MEQGTITVLSNLGCLDFSVLFFGDPNYTAAGGKASIIQNPCFWYAQKALAYTLF